MRDVDFIKQWEGCRLKAYLDVAGIPTIGYGHIEGVKLGDTITEEEALDLLNDDIQEYRACVSEGVKVEIKPSMYVALVSLAYNIGCNAFKKSTLLKRINEERWQDAGEEFLRWNKAGGKIVQGLINRRNAERKLFLSEIQLEQPMFHVEQSTEEKPMLPFLKVALPSLISALPEFAKIFSKEDVPERNTEALVKASEIVMGAVGATNVQQAVGIVQSDPQAAEKANVALRENRAELMDMLERLNAMEQGNIKAAREYNVNDEALFWKVKFVHILSLLVVVAALAGIGYVLIASDDATERSMALQTLLIVGFSGVLAYWIGSSQGSDKKTEILNQKDK